MKFIPWNPEYFTTQEPKVEYLVCPCNSIWMGTIPPPPCPFHDLIFVPPTVEYYPQTITSNKIEISEETWNKALAGLLGPEIMQEFIKKLLLWPFE